VEITSLAPWYGSKRTLGPRIVDELGKHRAYWEVFCGSMAVLLNKPQSSMETVNDLHGDLTNLARVIQRRSTAELLYDTLSRTWMCESIFREYADQVNAAASQPCGDEPDIERAVRFFVCAWMGRNGVAGTASYKNGFCVRYTKNGGHAGKRWRSAVDSIPEWQERLNNVVILNRNGFDLLDRIEDAEAVAIYCDPPYLVKAAKYQHDFNPDEHKQLADKLRRFTKTRVVVSYYDHPMLSELYPGWTVVDCTMNKAMSSQNGKAEKAPEVLLINGPSYTAL
jgi:DNA adenine methylase